MDKFQINKPVEKLEDGKWMLSEEDGYMRFLTQDSSDISVTSWKHQSIGKHSHSFYELTLITKGRCVHQYREVEAPLVPGDMFLIKPHEPHGYLTKNAIEIINCQFVEGHLNKECQKMLKSIIDYSVIDQCKEDMVKKTFLHRQGVVHLDMKERNEVEFLLKRMMEEQRRRDEGFESVKIACLQMLLVAFYRVRNGKLQWGNFYPDDKREQIYQAIDYMKEHLEEKLELTVLAQKSYWSEGHFRTVFKEVTGLSPLEYLNHLRIIKSMEYIEKDRMRISEAAEKVGIHDPGYYSRLFKKIMGYSPRKLKDRR